ncbi:MAG: oligosaccharide flippase family protein [Candidatus Aenigmatarchaeota archaeon]
MKLQRKIISNVFYYFLDIVTLSIFGYIFWILMGKMLVPEQYGILLTVVSLFYVFVSITTLGFHEALPKFISELVKKNKLSQIRSMITYSIKFVTITSLLLSVAIFFLSENTSLILYGSEKMIIPLQFLSILLFSGVLAYISKSILQGFQNFKKLFLADLTGNILKIIIAFVLVFIGLGVIGGIISLVVWFISVVIVSIIVIIKIFKSKLKKINFDKKKFFKFSLLSVVSLSSLLLIQQGGIIILGFLSTLESVAFLGVAFLVGQIVILIPIVIMGSLFPTFSSFWVKEKNKFTKLLSISIKVIVLTVLPLVILFTMLSDWIVKILYTTEYLPASFLFPGFLFGSFLLGINLLILIALYSANKPNLRALTLFIGMIINISLCFILIPTFGAQGAVFAFLTSQIFTLVFSLLFISKLIQLKFSRRSVLIIPVNIIFLILLFFIKLTEILVLKVLVILFSIMIYIILLFALKIINRNDLDILNYFPDKLGFEAFKRVVKRMINFFKR